MTQPSPQTAGRPAVVSSFFTFVVALTRIAIGWHFLYEGIVKFLDTDWTAAAYLQSSTGPLAGWFQWMASDAIVLSIVNQLNVWGLILIGACLMLGLAVRLSAFLGVVLLALYYLAYLPIFGSGMSGVAEGNYLIVDKNLVELLALCIVVLFPAGTFGLDGVLFGRRKKQSSDKVIGAASAEATGSEASSVPGRFSRRQLLASLTGVPFVGGFALAVLKQHGWNSHEETQLAARLGSGGTPKVDAITSPSKTFNWARLEDLKGKVPTARIGNVELSRVILGGNLMGGWAHARDLIYVSKLVKAYHHREKIFETFRLAEACGVNTILTNPVLCDVINEYWKIGGSDYQGNGGGKIQFISDCGGKTLLEGVQKSIDAGACACYTHGGVTDQLVAKEDFDSIEKALELIRRNGLPAGIGGHKLETVKGCRDKGLQPDFWMKTLHRGDYWSAFGGEQQDDFAHDNFWCWKPDEVVAYMKDVPEPWIAFKILAAGAIKPEVGFKYALEGGADFLCVGMYDFQLVEDVNLAVNLLDGDIKRQRPRRA